MDRSFPAKMRMTENVFYFKGLAYAAHSVVGGAPEGWEDDWDFLPFCQFGPDPSLEGLEGTGYMRESDETGRASV